MRNLSFLFLSIILFIFSIHAVHAEHAVNADMKDLKELDYYAYIVQASKIVICSEKEHVNSNLILNEFENENGYTCLLNLRKNGLYRITLHISQIEDKTGIYKEMIEKSLSESKKRTMMEVGLGKSAVIRTVELTSFKEKAILKKQFILNLDHGRITYLPDNNCDFANIEKCNFMDTKDALFMKKYVKVNFNFKEPNFQEITLLEKSMTSTKFKTTEDCDPACVFGICNDGDCLCKQGYMGANCSIKLQSKEFRVTMGLLAILFILIITIGILLALGLWYLYLLMFDKNELEDTSKEVDIEERWGKNENAENAN